MENEFIKFGDVQSMFIVIMMLLVAIVIAIVLMNINLYLMGVVTNKNILKLLQKIDGFLNDNSSFKNNKEEKMKKIDIGKNVTQVPIKNFSLPNQAQAATYITMTVEDFNTVFNQIKDYVVEVLKQRDSKIDAVCRYTPDEVCGLLSVSRPTLNKWDKDGYLVPEKIGRRVYYNASAIDAMRRVEK